MPRRTLLLILATAVVSMMCYERADRNPYGRYFAEVLQLVDRNYLEPVEDQKLFDGAVDGMLGKLDGYSSFITRQETAQFHESLDQVFGGIGLELGEDPKSKGLTVISPLVGTPAYRAGIHAGDHIVAIDGESTESVLLKEVIDKLRGKEGTKVTLDVIRDPDEKPLKFELTRAIIQVDSVLGNNRLKDGSWDYWLSEPDKIAYLRITSFGEPTARQLRETLEKLEKDGLRGLILDLRNNPGGLLPAATEICDQFLPTANLPIVTTRGRDGEVREAFLSKGAGKNRTYPVVLLVNHYSASASEIVAACLQDHHRATIVGERSWGKGTVQNVIPVEGGKSVLKLTVASYWRPSGKNIHRLKDVPETAEWGVSPDPDDDVKLTEEQRERWATFRREHDMAKSLAETPNTDTWETADSQLVKAFEVIKAQLAQSPSEPVVGK